MQVESSAGWSAEPCSILFHPVPCVHGQIVNQHEDPLLPQLGTPHSRVIRLKFFLLVEMQTIFISCL